MKRRPVKHDGKWSKYSFGYARRGPDMDHVLSTEMAQPPRQAARRVPRFVYFAITTKSSSLNML